MDKVREIFFTLLKPLPKKGSKVRSGVLPDFAKVPDRTSGPDFS